jgi:hypothetical protein
MATVKYEAALAQFDSAPLGRPARPVRAEREASAIDVIKQNTAIEESKAAFWTRRCGHRF